MSDIIKRFAQKHDIDWTGLAWIIGNIVVLGLLIAGFFYGSY